MNEKVYKENNMKVLATERVYSKPYKYRTAQLGVEVVAVIIHNSKRNNNS